MLRIFDCQTHSDTYNAAAGENCIWLKPAFVTGQQQKQKLTIYMRIHREGGAAAAAAPAAGQQLAVCMVFNAHTLKIIKMH